MLTLSATLSTHMCRRLYGEVWGVEGKGDRKAELLGTAVVALGIQFGAAPPHTIVALTPVGAMED